MVNVSPCANRSSAARASALAPIKNRRRNDEARQAISIVFASPVESARTTAHRHSMSGEPLECAIPPKRTGRRVKKVEPPKKTSLAQGKRDAAKRQNRQECRGRKKVSGPRHLGGGRPSWPAAWNLCYGVVT
jgi:hypothetical protein